jgi:hypothetical protein
MDKKSPDNNRNLIRAIIALIIAAYIVGQLQDQFCR